jgi:hypothetical protein
MALWDSMEKFVNESVRISQEAYERAKEYGKLTKMEFDLKGLQGKLQKEYSLLGAQAYSVLVEQGRGSFSAGDEGASAQLDAIKALAEEVYAKEKEIASLKDEINERRQGGDEVSKE